jgi:tetratricopeptide (TPR) repeat protein
MSLVNTYIQNAEHWLEQGRHRKAIEQYDLAILALEKEGNDTETLGDCHQELGSLWRLMGNNRNTGTHYTKAKDYYLETFGETPHIKTASIYFLLGSFLEQIWKLKPAETYFSTALSHLESVVDHDHPHINATKDALNRIKAKKESTATSKN